MSILVLASFAQDIIYHNDSLNRKTLGGPAFYIQHELDRLKQPYILAKSNPAVVHIYVKEHEETGEIVQEDKIEVPDSISEHSLVLLSTVSPKALDINDLVPFMGNLFVDIQGFLRTDDKNISQISNILALKCTKYIKGTAKEIHTLHDILEELPKDTAIIETMGKEGVRLHVGSTSRTFPVSRIIKSRDTIGAGDTFFTAYAVYVNQGYSVDSAIKCAINEVCVFLETKT